MTNFSLLTTVQNFSIFFVSFKNYGKATLNFSLLLEQMEMQKSYQHFCLLFTTIEVYPTMKTFMWKYELFERFWVKAESTWIYLVWLSFALRLIHRNILKFSWNTNIWQSTHTELTNLLIWLLVSYKFSYIITFLSFQSLKILKHSF